jgi:alkanesulfonate monooxygenase SsuD/methylene tetrahydromethanopterin reductase-like flavin-dependent oxidoreductase (luciferase family)
MLDTPSSTTVVPAVRFGAHIGQQNMTMDDMRALWRRLDRSLDWISCWDHLYEAPSKGGTVPHFEAMTVLGALAATTERVQVGCLVFYVGYRSPGVIAKAATTLDHLTHGRFNLGLGSGWHEPEARAFGYPFPSLTTRFEMLDESATIIRSLLTNDRTTFTGQHFHVDNASCLPAPVQPRLPIWIGGMGEKKTLPLVAKHADGWNVPYVSPTEFARLNGILDERCDDVGRDPKSVRRAINLMFNLRATKAQAQEEIENMRGAWGKTFDRVSEGGLFGTPDDAADRMREYINAGVQDINIALRAPWDNDALEAFLEEVVPSFQRPGES